MPVRRILADTNVCYPIVLLDLILRLDEVSLHEIVWTEDLLAELSETWVDHGARSRESADKVCDDIRRTFAGQFVPREEYEHLIEAMPGQDPDDRVHASAAAARSPIVIVTNNVRDFPELPLKGYGVGVETPDSYLLQLVDSDIDELCIIVMEMADDR